ncbi:MAG: tetratricopeptide repeat protein [archaeon GB-1867-035]|nr:tetratricopeptide repeat protein [Candidatus Culexmicrobium profundum]
MNVGRNFLNLVTNKVNLEILILLRNEPSYPRMLAELLGRDETHISKRLRVMERAGIVRGEWRRIGGKNVKLYSLNTDRIEIIIDFDGCKMHLTSVEGEKTLVITSLYDFRIPPPVNFIGRINELELLGSEKNFFIVEGMAGIGKTSLASKFVERVKESCYVFWHSLKEVDSFNFLVNKLAVFLSRLQYFDLLNYLKSGGLDDSVKMTLLLSGIDREDCVLVFDDYHRCRDERIDVLLGYLQRNLRRAKILVLSRVRPRFFSPLDPNVVEVKLSGLSVEETLELLSSRGILVGLDVAVKIQRKLSGHPLALNMFCEAVRGRRVVDVLEGLPDEGFLEYFWSEIYQHLNNREKALLKFMSIFRYPFPVRALMNVSGVRNIRGILYSLERKMLVGRINGRYFLHEVIRNLCYQLVDNPREMHRRVAEYYLSENSSEALLEAVYHIIKAGNFQRAAEVLREDLECRRYDFIERGFLAQYLELSERIPEKEVDELSWCWILYGKGRVYMAQGELERAIKVFSRSLILAEKLSNKILISKIIKSLGKAYLLKGNMDLAEKYFMKSLSLLEEIEDWSELGRTFLEGASIYLYKGKLDLMKIFLDKGLNLCHKAGDERSVAMGYYYYAGLYEMRGNWDKATECCEKSLRIFENIGNILWIATLHSELAFIKSSLHRFDEALKHFGISIELFEKAHLYTKLVEAYSDRALLYVKQGRLKLAEEDCERALKLRQYLRDFYYYGVTYRVLGMIATVKGDWIRAEEYFEKSVKLLSPVHQFHLAKTYLEMASMYQWKGELKNEIEYLNKALEIFRNLASKEEIKNIQRRIEEATSHSKLEK